MTPSVSNNKRDLNAAKKNPVARHGTTGFYTGAVVPAIFNYIQLAGYVNFRQFRHFEILGIAFDYIFAKAKSD